MLFTRMFANTTYQFHLVQLGRFMLENVCLGVRGLLLSTQAVSIVLVSD